MDVRRPGCGTGAGCDCARCGTGSSGQDRPLRTVVTLDRWLEAAVAEVLPGATQDLQAPAANIRNGEARMPKLLFFIKV